MNPTTKDKLSKRAQALIDEGEALYPSAHHPKIGQHLVSRELVVRIEDFHKWLSSCRHFVSQLGSAGKEWQPAFKDNPKALFQTAQIGIGNLKSLKEAIDNDLLTKVEDLITADAFGSLLEQADGLLAKEYVLAAGVLARAVLEEHLRKTCDRHGCLPADRPTINDLNQALYKGGHLDKLAMKSVDAMAAAGNHCAHNNQPPLDEADVRKLLTDVHDFMVRHPLS